MILPCESALSESSWFLRRLFAFSILQIDDRNVTSDNEAFFDCFVFGLRVELATRFYGERWFGMIQPNDN